MPPSPSTAEPTVAVVGAGAIGGLVAGRLALGGRSVAIGVRPPLESLVLEDAAGRHDVPVEVVTEPSALAPADWVVLATKAYDIGAASSWLDAAIGPSTVVAVAQNGIGHADRVARWVSPDRVVPLIVRHGAARPSRGVVRHTLMGDITVPDDANGRAFVALAEGCGLAVSTHSDFAFVQWTKLAWNLVGNSISTLVDRPVRDIGRLEDLRVLAARLVAECAAVAAAEGVVLDPGLTDDIITTMAGYDAEVRSSMWQDRAAGRRLEHDVISGAVLDLATRHGLAAPCSETVTRLLASLPPLDRS